MSETLSDKKDYCSSNHMYSNEEYVKIGKQVVFRIEWVKEFIRKLKDKAYDVLDYKGDLWVDVEDIDELAGEELI